MTHTFTRTFVTCPRCGHRLTEIILATGEAVKWYQTATGYICSQEDLVLNIGRAGPNYGCGAKYDLEGNPL